jgi:hypothetical protein
MRLPLLNKTAVILLTCLLGIATAPQAEAAPKTPRVTSVELDTDAGTMVVTGRDFGGKKFRGNVRLHLAETGPITLKVDKYKKLQPSDEVPILLQQLQLSGIPQNIDDFAGVHLLEVRRKYKEKVDGVSVVKYQIGTSLVTIGEQGPAGTDGVDGEQGPKGDKGDQGVAGPAGAKGDTGATGPQGLAGVSGVKGPKGDQGAAGQDGTDGDNGTDGVGVSQTTIDSDGNFIVTLTNGTEINAGQVGNSNSTLKLSKNSAVFDYTGGTGSVEIQSDTDWIGEFPFDSWLTTATPFGEYGDFTGNGNQTFTFEVAELTGYMPRETRVRFESASGPVSGWHFTIRQEPYLNPDPQGWSQLGSDINGEGDEDFSGWSVSLSADGSTVAIGAVGAYGNTYETGHVRVYQYDGTLWQQLGTDIDGERAGDQTGGSVSLSADGSIVAIGARYADPYLYETGEYETGHVRIYQYINSSWQQLGTDIDGERGGDQSGSSVSLSADGSTVAIGAPYNDANEEDVGHVRIYQFIDSSWVQLGADIDGEAEGNQFGNSVSLSGDGSTVAIGAPFNNGNGYESGHVRIYQYDGSSWQQLGADIDGEAEGDEFGNSVSLSANGSIVAIGAPFNKVNGQELGHVRIYQYINSSWQQLGTDIDGEAAGDESGNFVSLSSDGSIVAIGARFNDGKVYQYINSRWVQLGAIIDGKARGRSVSLSADGSTVAIGETSNDGNGFDRGQVRIYALTQEP